MNGNNCFLKISHSILCWVFPLNFESLCSQTGPRVDWRIHRLLDSISVWKPRTFLAWEIEYFEKLGLKDGYRCHNRSTSKVYLKNFCCLNYSTFVYKFDEIGDLRTNTGENKRKWAPHITEDSEPNSYILIDINAKSPNYGNKYARTFKRTPL